MKTPLKDICASASSAGRFALLVIGVALLTSSPAGAQGSGRWVGDATRLGAFSGAMRYCEERYGGSERRYRMARLRVADAVSDMEPRDKRRAIGARNRAYEGGHVLGNRLDANECRALLRMSEWKAWSE